MLHDGVPDDMSVQSLFDKATSAKNMVSRIRGYSPSRWVLDTQPRIFETLMIDDEEEDPVPHKDIPESQDDEFARSLRVRDATRRAFIAVDKDQRLRKAAVSASRPDRLTFEPGDLCYIWRDATGWSQLVKVISMLTMVEAFSSNVMNMVECDGTRAPGRGGCARIPGPRSRHGSCDW